MEMLEKFSLVGSDLYRAGLIDSGSGSISVREGDKIFVTRTGAMLGHLKAEDIMEISAEASSGDANAKDMALLRAIYKETAFNAVIIANPPYTIALSLTADNKINPQDAKGQLLMKSVPVVRVRDRSSQDELVKTIPPIYKSGYSISVIREYGSIAVAADLLEALKLTTCLEQTCKIIAVNKIMTPEVKREPHHQQTRERRTAIPPSIGVMDRSRGGYKRGFGR